MSSRKEYKDGRIVGTVDFPFEVLRDPKVPFPAISEEWRSAMDVYVISSDASIPLTGVGLTTKGYVLNGGATSLVSQNYFGLGDSTLGWGTGPGGVPPSADLFNWPIARIRSYGGEQLKVTVQSSFPESGPVTSRRVRLAYVAYGYEPCAEVDPISFWTRPQDADNGSQVLAGGGILLDLHAINLRSVDQWLWLYDDGAQRPGPTPAITPMLAGPYYLPPNGKGQAFIDFRPQRGLRPRYGVKAFVAATPGTPIVRDTNGQFATWGLIA